MKPNKHRGLGMLWVVAILAMIPVILAILSVSTVQLSQDTRMQSASAQADNLMYSAISWAQANQERIVQAPKKQIITPDLSELKIPGSVCRITVESTGDKQTELIIYAEVHQPKAVVRLEQSHIITHSQR